METEPIESQPETSPEPRQRLSERVAAEVARQTTEREIEAAYSDLDDAPPIPQHRRTSDCSPLAKRITQRIQQSRFEQ